MAYRNQIPIKLGKSLLQLRKEFISSKKLLTKFILPFSTFSTPILKSKTEYKTKQLKLLRIKSPRHKETNLNKLTFREITDLARKCFVNGDPPSRNLSTSIKEAQRSKLLNQISFKSNFALYSSKTCPPKACQYPEEIQTAMNQQILAELNAGYAYLSMACYFGRTDVALPGCYGFFMEMHKEEQEHAFVFINYQNLRGGHVKLCPLTIPESQNWHGICNSLAVAVEMEKLVKEKLIYLHDIAEKYHDLSVMDLVSSHFINEQDRSICELNRLLIRATRMIGNGVGEFLFDAEIHKAFVKRLIKIICQNLLLEKEPMIIWISTFRVLL